MRKIFEKIVIFALIMSLTLSGSELITRAETVQEQKAQLENEQVDEIQLESEQVKEVQLDIESAGENAVFVEPEVHFGDLQLPPQSEGDLAEQTRYADWGTDAMLEEADARAQELVAELVTDEMPDIQKAFVLAKYLNENVEYGVRDGYEQYRGQTAYEALIMGESVCAGNAAAYEMLCYYAGINVVYLMSNNMCHAWVQIELDGNWYYVDAQNCLAFDTFLMTPETDPEYDQADVDTYCSPHHSRYDYEDIVHPCNDNTFGQLEFKALKILEVEQGRTYYTYGMDWPTFTAAMESARIDVKTYFSTTVKSIIADYVGEKLYEGDCVKKKDVEVKPISIIGTPNAAPTYQAGNAIAADEFTIEDTVLEEGENALEISARIKPRVDKELKTTLYVTGNPDVLKEKRLLSIAAEYIGDDVFVGREVDKSLIKVVPSYSFEYESGRTTMGPGEEVYDFRVSGTVAEGSNNITVSYTEDGTTVETRITVRGVYPEIQSIGIEDDEMVVDNGQHIILDYKDAAYIELSDGERISADVIWKSSTEYDPDDSDEQIVTFSGTVLVPSGVRNNTYISTDVTKAVRVLAAEEQLELNESDEPGLYSESIMLSLDSSEGAQIFYTINGSEKRLYHGPIPLLGHEGSTTSYDITAYAHLRGYRDSELLTGTWEIDALEEEAVPEEIFETAQMVKGEKYSIFSDGCKYVSQSKRIASVNKKGIVTAKRAGETTILKYSGGVVVGRYLIKVDVPRFDKKEYTIIKGDTFVPHISGTSEPASYYTSDTTGKVSMVGDVLYAKSKGKITLYARVHGKKYKTKIAIEAPYFAKSKLSIRKGKKQSLKLKGTKSKNVQYESSDPSIVRTSGGKIYGVSVGTATVTATVGEHEYTCLVTVR